MSKKLDIKQKEVKRERPSYNPPEIITYSSDELLAELGPAQACSGFTGAVAGCP